MNKFEVTIEVEKSACEGNARGDEVARLLHKAADKVASGAEDGMLIDGNGKKVGEFGFERA